MKYFFFVIIAALTQSCAHHEETFNEAQYFDTHYSAYTSNIAPGFSILITKKNEVLKKSSYGHADVSMRIKIDSETRFRLASVTKAFTGSAVHLLEEKGLLSQETIVRKIIPELPVSMNKMTVGNLLRHTSGLPPYDSLCERTDDPQKVVTNKKIIQWLAKNQKLHYEPGSSYEYSNTGYVVLAEIVERVSGKPFDEVIKEHFFSPLKMKDSFFYSTATEKNRKMAKGYGSWPWFYEFERNSCNYPQGDDGIYTTIDDYYQWTKSIKMNMNLIKSKKTMAGIPVDYAYGWNVGETKFGKLISHNGSWAGFKTSSRYYSQHDVWIVIFSNYSDIPMEDIIADAEAIASLKESGD